MVFSSGKFNKSVFLGFDPAKAGNDITAIWIDEMGNYTMKKQKKKKLTREQKIVERFSNEIKKQNEELNALQRTLNQRDYQLQMKDKEIVNMETSRRHEYDARMALEVKLSETRGHINAALNCAKNIKNLPQWEVFQVIGKMQGRLEAAQGYDSYGMGMSVTSAVDLKNINTCAVKESYVGAGNW